MDSEATVSAAALFMKYQPSDIVQYNNLERFDRLKEIRPKRMSPYQRFANHG